MKLPQTCTGCPLFAWDKNFVLTEGDGSLRLLVVSEAPGEWEDEEGRPLSPNGASGKVFRRALRELGIPANKLTITNILRSRPPDNELRGAPYEREAIDHCKQYLDRTVAETKPQLILALGDTPQRELETEHIASNTVMRGFVRPTVYDIPMISTYHPSYIARGAWQLYGVFKHDIATAARFATRGLPTQLETAYQLQPTLQDVERFIRTVLADCTVPVSYDVETAHILGEQEPEDWRQKRVVQIQFSIAPGQAIVLPWDNGVFTELAKRVLLTENPKYGWNSRLSDDLVLEVGYGCVINGERHDLMNAWGHLQPSFWGGRDDKDTDKGVPSRLMGLQSCASFYCPELGPWKHLGTPEQIKANPELLRLYGAYDGDRTTRVGIGIMASLEAQGLMGGYRSHKIDLRPTLDYLGEIGLPVDRTKQTELRTYVQGELQRLQTEIQGLIPDGVTGVHPKGGYKTTKKRPPKRQDNAIL